MKKISYTLALSSVVAILILGLISYAFADDVVDSYSESNWSTSLKLYSFISGRGQAFTSSGNYDLTSAQFYIFRVGTISGNVTANLYAVTGTYGTDAKPTGAALATSDPVDSSTISTGIGLVSFTFSSPYSMVDGTFYVMALEFSGGDVSNYIGVGADNTSPSHDGNDSYYNAGSWTGESTYDYAFYVYGTLTPSGPTPETPHGRVITNGSVKVTGSERITI